MKKTIKSSYYEYIYNDYRLEIHENNINKNRAIIKLFNGDEELAYTEVFQIQDKYDRIIFNMFAKVLTEQNKLEDGKYNEDDRSEN